MFLSPDLPLHLRILLLCILFRGPLWEVSAYFMFCSLYSFYWTWICLTRKNFVYCKSSSMNRWAAILVLSIAWDDLCVGWRALQWGTIDCCWCFQIDAIRMQLKYISERMELFARFDSLHAERHPYNRQSGTFTLRWVHILRHLSPHKQK